jgi:ubiquinone biosynthesis protein
MWSTPEPVVGAWIADDLGPVGRPDDLSRGRSVLAAFLADAPRASKTAPAAGAGWPSASTTSRRNHASPPPQLC